MLLKNLAAVPVEHVARRARNFTKLLPGDDAEGAPRSKDWRLFVNANIEIEA